MRAFIRYGLSTYQMVEVTEAEMDKLQQGGDGILWPHRFSPETRRVYPEPREQAELIFYDTP
jgi:hypothetical protein